MLNSDVHQFHKYQQNDQSPLIFTEVTIKTSIDFDGNPDTWERHIHVVWLNRLMGSQPSLFENLMG